MSDEAVSDVRSAFPRVLIVDDDVALANGLKSAIESQGYVVHAVHRGALAFEATAVFRPDLIVLDVMMPEVDGWDVLSRLRKNQSTENIPVIMLTAVDTDTAKVNGFTLGADDYVTKPFSIQELRCRIAAVLRRSTSQDEQDFEIPVVIGGSQLEFVRSRDVYFIEGVRNYTYVHTAASRFLSRLTLGAIEQQEIASFRRVHRSFIVNMDHVRGCGWASKSAYRLRLSDLHESEIPVSRTLVPDVQRALGVRS